MQYWNGRGQLRNVDTHTYICANTKAEALRLGTQTFGNFKRSELDGYFSKCWGHPAQETIGEQTEPGVFVEIRSQFFKWIPPQQT